jgi:hypothetical protein
MPFPRRFGVRLEEADDPTQNHVNVIGERAQGVEEVPMCMSWEHEALGTRFTAPNYEVLVPQGPVLTLLSVPAPTHLPEKTVIAMTWTSLRDTPRLVHTAEQALGFFRGPGGVESSEPLPPVLFYAPRNSEMQELEAALADKVLALENWGVLRRVETPASADPTIALLTLLEAFPASTYLLTPALALDMATSALQSADFLANVAVAVGQGAAFVIAPRAGEGADLVAKAREAWARLPELLRGRLFPLSML